MFKQLQITYNFLNKTAFRDGFRENGGVCVCSDPDIDLFTETPFKKLTRALVYKRAYVILDRSRLSSKYWLQDKTSALRRVGLRH